MAVTPRDNDVFKEKVLDAVVQIENHVNRHVAKKRKCLNTILYSDFRLNEVKQNNLLII